MGIDRIKLIEKPTAHLHDEAKRCLENSSVAISSKEPLREVVKGGRISGGIHPVLESPSQSRKTLATEKIA
jgi:hypothetical protein